MKNIPLKVVKKLRNDRLVITSIADDEDITKLSEKEKAVLTTFDKDFREIIFRKSIKPYSLILLRTPPKSVDYIYNFLKQNQSRI